MRFKSEIHLWMACVVMALAGSIQADLAETYQAKWGAEESKATTAESRAALAGSLYAAAESESDRAMKLMLHDKAYAWGSLQKSSYVFAAKSLQAIQGLDPTRRLEALEKLGYLYGAAYNEDTRKNLGQGIGLADVRYKSAQQRSIDILEKHIKTGVEKVEFLSEINLSKREYVGAKTVAVKVVAAAEGYMRRLQRYPDRVAALEKFVAENKPLIEKIDRGQKDLDDLRKAYLAGEFVVEPEPVQVVAVTPPAAQVPVAETPAISKPAPPKTPDAIVPLPGTPKPIADDNPSKPQPETKPVERSADDKKPAPKVGVLSRVQTCPTCLNKYIPDVDAKGAGCFWCQKKGGIFDFPNAP